MSTEIKTPTPEEIDALREVRKLYGDRWKDKLADAWIKGTDVNLIPNGSALRRVRNNFGPSWLYLYEIPITEAEYLEALRTVYKAANLSDTEFRAPWMKGDECGTHCRAIETIVDDMGLGEVWANILEDGPKDYVLKLRDAG